MHAWMWLQGFPTLEPQVEEGLCELAAYLFLLSCLRDPPSSTSVELDQDALRKHIRSIEANTHPPYGPGFRLCVASLRGRKLHELLGYVRQYARLPPPVEQQTTGLGFDGVTSARGGTGG